MRKSAQVAMWAVYQMTVQGQPGPKIVCAQHEWDAVEEATPGLHRLIKAGIMNEGEAERLARGTSGDDPVRMKKKLIAELLDAQLDLITVDSRGRAGIEKDQNDATPLLLPFLTHTKELGGLGVADEPQALNGTGPDGEVA